MTNRKLIAYMILATLIRWAPFLVIVALLALCLTGCGGANKVGAVFGGYVKTCVEGVTYLQFPSGAALMVDITGKPVGCTK